MIAISNSSTHMRYSVHMRYSISCLFLDTYIGLFWYIFPVFLFVRRSLLIYSGLFGHIQISFVGHVILRFHWSIHRRWHAYIIFHIRSLLMGMSWNSGVSNGSHGPAAPSNCATRVYAWRQISEAWIVAPVPVSSIAAWDSGRFWGCRRVPWQGVFCGWIRVERGTRTLGNRGNAGT